jgi:hypothetical protein
VLLQDEAVCVVTTQFLNHLPLVPSDMTFVLALDGLRPGHCRICSPVATAGLIPNATGRAETPVSNKREMRRLPKLAICRWLSVLKARICSARALRRLQTVVARRAHRHGKTHLTAPEHRFGNCGCAGGSSGSALWKFWERVSRRGLGLSQGDADSAARACVGGRCWMPSSSAVEQRRNTADMAWLLWTCEA